VLPVNTPGSTAFFFQVDDPILQSGIDFYYYLPYTFIHRRNSLSVYKAMKQIRLHQPCWKERRIMYERCISQENLDNTGFCYMLSLINGKYKMTILYTLMEFGIVRFNELKRYITGISYKTLSTALKELEADQLVHREEYPQIPPKVEYSLTERGKTLIPILDAMCAWGDENRI
jgi:DNA-binding HxlR family transcriptional regulator